jgi:hypothetical protein
MPALISGRPSSEWRNRGTCSNGFKGPGLELAPITNRPSASESAELDAADWKTNDRCETANL